ncbi:MAG: DR2241 family protein [Verrucomicrobiota bacterium]
MDTSAPGLVDGGLEPEVSPALRACLERVPDAWVFGLVSVQRQGSRFRLVHREDAREGGAALRPVLPGELRDLAHWTAEGAYRPLKSAPTLQRGWEVWLAGPRELEAALERLHPGALADWQACVVGGAVPAAWPEVAARQTGRYRRIRELDDGAVQAGLADCCSPGRCAKERRWVGPGEPPPGPASAPRLVCLDPCPLLWDTLREAAGAGPNPGLAAA